MIDKTYRSLADPTRRAILRLLGDRDMTAGEIGEHFGMTAPAMSHHFNVLKEGGLVEARRNGQQIVYSLNTTAMQDFVRTFLDTFASPPKPDSGDALSGETHE